MADLLDAVAARLAPILDDVITAEADARARRDQLELYVSSLEAASEPLVPDEFARFGSGLRLDVDAMRSDAAAVHRASGRASTLRDNVATLVEYLRHAAAHFHTDLAESRALDTADAHLQSAVDAARDQERSRLAREMHDGPAQVFSNAARSIAMVERAASSDPATLARELGRLRSLLRESEEEVRRFMLGLLPATLGEHGLVAATRRYVDERGALLGLAIELDIEPDLPSLGSVQELTVYRTLQEAVQNIHKHAASQRVQVSLRGGPRGVTLEVRDDGRGFDPTFALHRPGSGLSGMRQRAELIGARLIVTSASGAGSTVQLVVPHDVDVASAGVRADLNPGDDRR